MEKKRQSGVYQTTSDKHRPAIASSLPIRLLQHAMKICVHDNGHFRLPFLLSYPPFVILHIDKDIAFRSQFRDGNVISLFPFGL